MTIHLDHAIVPARDQRASAQRLAELLGVPWSATTIGPFSAVYVNDGMTLDFQDTDDHGGLARGGRMRFELERRLTLGTIDSKIIACRTTRHLRP